MEFLMTYGWALLVIIVVISILFYIGVLNPKAITPSSCTFAPGLTCAWFKLNASNGDLVIKIGQAVGRKITINNISCTQNTTSGAPAAGVYGMTGVAAQTVSNGEQTGFLSIDCFNGTGTQLTSGTVGDAAKFRLWVNYTEYDTSIQRLVAGDLTARYEPG